MRPIRLEMEGFTAFRKPTIVDFEGVEIFVLAGPTGSGKSSIIDAITFALYGSVPRYDDLKLVHPVVSQGKLQMKVRFDFEINQKRYSATRVVRKTGKDQATTKEARLQCGDEVLAGAAKEMSEKVRELFGLDFDQFNTCIVLPQGQFAKFLHEKPARRQDLLKDLLHMNIYGKIGSRAREITSIKDAELTVKLKSLEDIAIYTTEVLDLEREKLNRLKVSKEEVEKLESRLEKLRIEAENKRSELKARELLISKLSQMEVPESDTLLTRYAEVGRVLTQHRQSFEEAEKVLEKKGRELDQLPDPLMLKDEIHLLEVLQSKGDKLAELQIDLRALKVELEKATNDLTGCENKYEEVQLKYQQSRKNHQLHEIIQDLKVGDPCPICETVLIKQPDGRDSSEVDFLEAEAKSWNEKLRISEKKKTTTEANYHSLMKQHELHLREMDDLQHRRKAVENVEELRGILFQINQKQEDIRNRKEKVRHLKINFEKATADHQQIELEIAGLWKQFDQTRDSLAVLSPPESDRNDLQGTLKKFHDWTAEQTVLLKAEVMNFQLALNQIESQIADKYAEISAIFERELLTYPEDGHWRDLLISEITKCEGQIRLIEAGLKRQKTIKTEIRDLKTEIALHKKLALHMKANAFERWLLHEAFKNLVFDASARLRDLSSGDYSFALDDNLNFDIIDHRNADEVRSSRTLSGGETFLASLALALSLADQMAELASGGTAKLESMFLDEGFGTLDSDTLDTVAGTIEALSARGRMIGLVTHVKDLADRMPVQFLVRKGPDTSTVDKILT